MRFLLRKIVTLIFIFTLIMYLMPFGSVFELIAGIIANLDFSWKSLSGIYLALRIVIVTNTDIVILMIFEVLCIIALRKKQKKDVTE
ncbi:hypothetical protein [Acholeplasma hippikon]|uniref:Uncharacterized protein n=1 Tax=Acholeplasma hippikon TaxID=264636 RepID=A0A449BK56_9MOLU|nr:hypothetical protein [Acholeplasma hippikon]VEU82773.1 Uncharacterised protein [Acholeplasma hippikon]